MRRLLVIVALTAALAGLGAAPAGATNECRGLIVCVPVAGPWVVVPTGPSAPRPRVEYQLSCPRGYIAGGLDAELSDRAIDVSFIGKLGSPVNPGVTTSRAIVFVGTYVGRTARAPSFRPHVGCIPAAGGGRIPTSVAAAPFPPGQPTVRRVKQIRAGLQRSQRVQQGCAAGERLVGAFHSVGFYTRRPPEERLVASVRATRTVGRNRVTVTVRAAADPRVLRAVVQVGAVCAGGQ